MDVEAVAARIEADLAARGDAAVGAKQKAYLKSDLTFLGVAQPGIREVVRGIDEQIPADALLPLVERLWGDVHEPRAVAVTLLERRAKKLGPDAVPLLERLLRTSWTWAYVDAIAVHVVGSIAERHDLTATLDRWAGDPDFWIRRSAMLALLDPLKRGGGDLDRFFRYADAMLEEREFFIRKAIGWILRDTSKRRPDAIAAWVSARKPRMAGLTFREAIRHLPASAQDDLRRK